MGKMKGGGVKLGTPFFRIQQAREALKDRATAYLLLHEKAILDALAAGKQEVALDALQWALEHIPAEDGATVLETGIDRPKSVDGYKGPSIQVGFNLGGLTPTPTLAALPPMTPAEVIEVEVEAEADTMFEPLPKSESITYDPPTTPSESDDSED